MMTPAALIRVSDLKIYRRFGINSERPIRVELPGRITVSPASIGYASPNGSWMIVKVVEPAPPAGSIRGEEIERVLDGDTLTILYESVPAPIEAVKSEEAELEGDLAAKYPRVLFELAKKLDPTLTPVKFRAWVRGL